MVHTLIISHGELCNGMMDTVKMVAGDDFNAKALPLYPGVTSEEYREQLKKLVEERDKNDGPELQLQLQSIYRAYFNHPSTFYYDQDAEYILNEMGQNYGGEELLTRIDMLSELLYQDALLKESEEQKYLLRKSLFLLNYLDTHSDTFSFERRGKIGEIEKKIGD